MNYYLFGGHRDQLVDLNEKVDNLTLSGTYNISDIVDAVKDVKGPISYDLTDIYNKLDSIDTQIMMKEIDLSQV